MMAENRTDNVVVKPWSSDPPTVPRSTSDITGREYYFNGINWSLRRVNAADGEIVVDSELRVSQSVQ